MLGAISSLISKTIDIFLVTHSKEGRRRKFSKQLFDVYKSLDEIAVAISNIELVVRNISQCDNGLALDLFKKLRLPEYIRVQGRLSSEAVECETFYLDEHGSEKTSSKRKIAQKQLLSIFLSNEIRILNRAFSNIARIMEAESFELYEAKFQPDKLRALAIFDKELVDTFVKAWFFDGGFIEGLMMLGLHQEIDERLLILCDAEFRERQTESLDLCGFPVGTKETVYDLKSKNDVEAFLTYSESCRKV
jgi:hypothetical protein